MDGQPGLRVEQPNLVCFGDGESFLGAIQDTEQALFGIECGGPGASAEQFRHCQTADPQRADVKETRDLLLEPADAFQRRLQFQEWLEARLERLLPVEHFHVVFTLLEALKPLMLRHQRLLYDLLFLAASQTLLRLAADSKRLGAQIGITAILHTWGQNLLFHPHLHCVVTGGGLAPDGQRWIAGRPRYFLPRKVLGRLFRGKFLARLKQLYDSGELSLAGSVAHLAQADAFRRWLTSLYGQEWQVYAKAPFGGAEQVFRYLGRYSHRVAISNNRLVELRDGQVSFRWKDYADDNRPKVMRLSAEEFLRRFLLHVLPKRFVRIRHYGLFFWQRRTGSERLHHQIEIHRAEP